MMGYKCMHELATKVWGHETGTHRDLDKQIIN